jgi:hypothetical protein
VSQGVVEIVIIVFPSDWLRLFSSQTFSLINTPTFSTPVILHTYLPMKMEQTECSEMLAYKIQTPGNYPEESIQHSEHDESLKSGMEDILDLVSWPEFEPENFWIQILTAFLYMKVLCLCLCLGIVWK